MKTVAMIGAGAWGTAVSTVLAHNGFQVNLWSHETTIAQIINKDHENTTFFPGVTLSEKIHATNCLKTALKSLKTAIQMCGPFNMLKIIFSIIIYKIFSVCYSLSFI